MAEIDYVVRELILSQKAAVDIISLYRVFKNWFKNNRYDLLEREYENIKQEALSTKIKFDANKSLDEYTKANIRVTLSIKDYEESGRVVKGAVELKFESSLNIDYEERYENRPLIKFFRALYDKIIAREKFSGYEEEVKNDTYSLYNEIKAFLNLHRLK
ncbi:MAG: hypothetical protein AB1571_00290 [Nanoarchaeota archaeon]